MSINPELPSKISGGIEFQVPFGSGTIRGNIFSIEGNRRIGLNSTRINSDIKTHVRMRLSETEYIEEDSVLSPKVEWIIGGPQVAINAQKATISTKLLPQSLTGIKLATAVVRSDIKSLKGPTHRILTNQEVKQSNVSAELLLDVSDREGDDKGPGTYVYPQTVSLKAGSLDITHCTVRSDEKNIYFALTFRALSDPGWHPEYGFQLTYAAIAIDKDGKPGSGKTLIGMNAQYTLDPNTAYENIIYVGGGVRIEDAASTILAEYLPLPGDEQHPLGNVSTKSVSFSLPQEIIGHPTKKWRYTILVGAQDDHGGAGIGEFRNVEYEAKEWVGGGKVRHSDPNVFDVILSQ
jgi:carbohydrate-binding DOMON domain-containing protein